MRGRSLRLLSLVLNVSRKSSEAAEKGQKVISAKEIFSQKTLLRFKVTQAIGELGFLPTYITLFCFKLVVTRLLKAIELIGLKRHLKFLLT